MDDVLTEERRLEALDRYDLLDTPREEAFDRIVRLTKRILQVPTATLSLLDAHRQWFKACEGFPGTEVPRDQTFCNRTVKEEHPLIVEDATKDPRFSENPYVVGEPHVRFYAGVPLRSRDGFNVGTLCAVDTKPRALGSDDLQNLQDLAGLAMDAFEMRLVATEDSLTGSLTRRAFKEQAQRSVALALRHRHELSCVVLDLDRFKSINDNHGHPAGDLVLTKTIAICAEALRDTDLLGRMGGEEFAIQLPDTGLGGALEVAEKLRIAIESTRFEIDGISIPVTASFGVACLGPGTQDLDALLGHADSALYAAKAAGRNRSEAWRSPEAEPGQIRRRTLKAGKILFHGRQSTMDCTIRSLSDEGADLDVSSTVGLPRKFQLSIKADGTEKRCRVMSQTDKHLDVVFC